MKKLHHRLLAEAQYASALSSNALLSVIVCSLQLSIGYMDFKTFLNSEETEYVYPTKFEIEYKAKEYMNTYITNILDIHLFSVKCEIVKNSKRFTNNELHITKTKDNYNYLNKKYNDNLVEIEKLQKLLE